MMLLKRICAWLWPGKSKVDKPKATERIRSANSVAEQNHAPAVAERNEIARESVQIVVGLDFGTAFTKVVLRGAGQQFGVPLNDNAHGTNRFLLPTRLYEDSTGNLSVADSKYRQKVHTHLKMKILEDNLDDETRKHIVVYLAHVLRKSRAWLMTEQKGVYGNNILKWAVNIGLPTEKYEDVRLKETYINLVDDAWNESVLSPENDGAERKLHRDMIHAFPEFVAQIQGYIKSAQRAPGIHVLADVGAGTIDVTVFIVHQHEGENRHTVLDAQIQKLGTIHLADHRCKQQKAPGDWRPDPQDPFPSCDEFAKQLGVSVQEIETIDEEFKRAVCRQITSCLQRAYQGLPSQGDWESGVPLMLCGGGARVKFYETAYFQDVVADLKRVSYGQSLRESHFPELIDLDASGLPDQDYDRLSVAYGLSFDALNIGETSRPPTLDAKEKPEEKTVSKRICSLCRGDGGGHSPCRKCDGTGFV